MQNQPNPTMPTATTQPVNLGHPTHGGLQPCSQHVFPFPLMDSMQPDRYRFQERLYNLPPANLGNVKPLTTLLNSLWHSGQVPAVALNLTTLLIHLALPFWHALLTLMKLEELANALTIIFGELPEQVNGETWTTTRPLSTMPGRGAHIVISQEYLTQINATSEAEDPINFQILCLRIAITIVHELAHAAALANSGRPDPDGNTFMGDSQSNEIGFEIEKYLFGGILDLDPFFSESENRNDGWYYAHNNMPSRIKYRIVMLDWPNNDMVNHYAATGASCACLAHLPPAGLYWTTSFLHISRLFQKSYWDHAVDRFALHFPRSLGELRSHDPTWNPQDLLKALMPDGNNHHLYVVDRYFRVYFVQKLHDPSAQTLREFWDSFPKNSKFLEWEALVHEDFGGMDRDLKVAMERVLATTTMSDF
ncbi:hypothetical protein AC579_6012 [Pseudocercospora musae]|uniref:Uncharacterized protein n=1 Tax=Pseudocercospora musae TaxID=113226 RepID=A0A139H794_9PEZI|nr:hypothetical protein AC579_6012 [Pseudocercospora musae]